MRKAWYSGFGHFPQRVGYENEQFVTRHCRRQGRRRACFVLVVGRVGLRLQNRERDCPIPGCLPFRCSQGDLWRGSGVYDTDRSKGCPGRRVHRNALARRPLGPGFDPHRGPEQSQCKVHYASQRDGTRCELGSQPHSDSPVAVGQDGADCRCNRGGNTCTARKQISPGGRFPTQWGFCSASTG